MEAKLDWDAVFDEERVVVAFDGVGSVGHHGRKGNVEVGGWRLKFRTPNHG